MACPMFIKQAKHPDIQGALTSQLISYFPILSPLALTLHVYHELLSFVSKPMFIVIKTNVHCNKKLYEPMKYACGKKEVVISLAEYFRKISLKASC